MIRIISKDKSIEIVGNTGNPNPILPKILLEFDQSVVIDVDDKGEIDLYISTKEGLKHIINLKPHITYICGFTYVYPY